MTPELIAQWAREDREMREKKAREDAERLGECPRCGGEGEHLCGDLHYRDSQQRRDVEEDVEESLKRRLATSHGRFGWRIEKWQKATGSALPHHFWWFVHNCVAHPMIGVTPLRPTFAFHDYTSKKINRE